MELVVLLHGGVLILVSLLLDVGSGFQIGPATTSIEGCRSTGNNHGHRKHDHGFSLLQERRKEKMQGRNPSILTTSALSTPSSICREFASTSFFEPTVGSIVTIECSLVPEGEFIPEPLIDGILMEDDEKKKKKEEPQILTFVLGKGNYLPGLHELILTSSLLRRGETVSVSMDAGWGERNPALEATVKFSDLANNAGFDREQIKEGVKLVLSNGLKCTVTNVSDETFRIDGNPPLAGASYKATVKLLNVEKAPIEFGDNRDDNDDNDDNDKGDDADGTPEASSLSKYQVATFALGCFWGGELEYMRESGVVGTKVGYTQGTVPNPSYKQVCTGTTGHTEAIMVCYDSTIVSYDRLVHLAMNRLGENKYLRNQVGNDRGPQYRHGVYYHNKSQKETAESIVLRSFGNDCKTECLPAKTFWTAEDGHQQYLLKGGQSARKNDKSVIRCYG